MGFYRRYQKLVKCYADGTPVVPEEYMKGDFVGIVDKTEFSCQYAGNYGGEFRFRFPNHTIDFRGWVSYDTYTSSSPVQVYPRWNSDFKYYYVILPPDCYAFRLIEGGWLECEVVGIPNLLYKELYFDGSSKKYTSIDVSGATDGRNLKHILFLSCTHLTHIIGLEDVDVSNITNMSYMFDSCFVLEINNNLKKWNVSNVTNMSYMFNGVCKNLSKTRYFDLTGWNVGNVLTTSNMFRGSGVWYIKLSGWNTYKLKDASEMFEDCGNLENLDVSGWNTTAMETVEHLVRNCPSLKFIDFSGWDLSHLTAPGASEAMFEADVSLEHIRCSTSFRDWCWANQDNLYLPTKMRQGNSGTWELVD